MPVRIDSIKLMYATFQSCRYARPETDYYLPVLVDALNTLRQQQTFIVPLPAVHKRLPQTLVHQIRAPWFLSLYRTKTITSAAQPFLHFTVVGVAELQRLWVAQRIEPVRRLGYAFHNIPQFLRTPATFDLEAYQHCFRIAGAYWSELSAEMQQHFCTLLGLSEQQARELLEKREM
jgi:hypothetical protein